MQQQRRSGRAAPRAPLDLDSALSRIEGLKIDSLRAVWQEWVDEPPPPCQSRDVLRRLLAWRLQEERYGGLSPAAKRKLKDMVALQRRDPDRCASAPLLLTPGTMVTREWRGLVHRVHVLEDGFAHNGKRYGSLSEIARAITGKRWSGPRFFRLEAKTASSGAKRQSPESEASA